MKKFIFLFCFFVMGFNLYSESVYTYSLKKDIVISTLSIGLFLGSYLMNNERTIPGNLDRNDVNIFDRGLMYPSNATIYNFRYIQLYFLPYLPIITPFAVGGWNIIKEFDTWLTYGIMYTQAFLLTYGTRLLIGKTVHRYRPREYFREITSPINNNSFPSGTTATAFMPATFFSVTFSAEFPDSPWRIPIIVGTHTLAAVVGITRVFSGVHFLTDVLAGAAIGSFYGWLIPTLHRRTNDKISFHSTGNGGYISLKF